MKTESLWETFSSASNFPSLRGELTVDVAVIGGGITGVTAAQLLSSGGLKVAILESGKIGGGNTGYSTGNLYSVIDNTLPQFRKLYGPQVTSEVVNARAEAVNLIEENVKQFNLDCDFKRVPWHIYSAVSAADKNIDDIFEIGNEINLDITFSDLASTPFRVRKGLVLNNQAQINPMRYAQALAKAIQSKDCFIFENSNVEKIDNHGGHTELVTKAGTLSAKYVIHATHTPKGIKLVHTMLGPYREYGIACKLQSRQHPEGIYWGYYKKDETISTRTYERDGKYYLVVVGKSHKVGQGDSNAHIRELQNFAAKYFDVIEFTHKWGGQHYKPADYLPYIGPFYPGASSFMATGFSTDGLTYGTLSAQIIADEIQGADNAYSNLFSPLRLRPFKVVPRFVKENTNVLVQYAKDYLGKTPKDQFSEISIGEGQVIEHNHSKVAAYRDEDENLHVSTAICPHMGCVVHWNNAEESWDCPCHGSRFAKSGEVLEGPTLAPLKNVHLDEERMDYSEPSADEGQITSSV